MDTRAEANVTTPILVPAQLPPTCTAFPWKKNNLSHPHDTCRITAWPSKGRPSCAQTQRGHSRPVDQSRILAGTNLRMIISRMAYLLKHEGEDNSAIESRDSAGMVTYERTSVLLMASAQSRQKFGRTTWAHLLNLGVDAIDGTEPLPCERL
jgi:hypothetical protein